MVTVFLVFFSFLAGLAAGYWIGYQRGIFAGRIQGYKMVLTVRAGVSDATIEEALEKVK